MFEILSTISAEPVRFIIAIAYGIKYGAGIQDALLFDKVCLYELDYTEEICANLTLYEEEEIRVQEVVNSFNLGKSMASAVMYIIASFFVGGFADRFGFKMTLIVSFIGDFFHEVVDWVFYIFLEDIPLYFLYADIPFKALNEGYFIAMYGLINNFVSKNKLATRIAFSEGIYTIGWIIGVTPSAPIFRALGYYGVYVIHDVTMTMAFLYHLMFVHNLPKGQFKEAAEKVPGDHMENGDKIVFTFENVGKLIKAGTVDVIKDLFNSLVKPRPHHMRPLIILTYVGMMFYYTSANDISLTYAYMYLMFGVTPEQYSLFSATSSVVNLMCVFGLMPFMRHVLKLHESIILTLVLVIGSVLVILSSLAQVLIPGFLLVFSLANVRYLCYPNGRTLLVKMADDDELPKMYGFLNIITNAIGLVGIPLYRGIYAATLETFPGAFLMLSASLMTCAAMLYFVLITQRRKIEMVNRMKKTAKESKENTMHNIDKEQEGSSPEYEIDTHM